MKGAGRGWEEKVAINDDVAKRVHSTSRHRGAPIDKRAGAFSRRKTLFVCLSDTSRSNRALTTGPEAIVHDKQAARCGFLFKKKNAIKKNTYIPGGKKIKKCRRPCWPLLWPRVQSRGSEPPLSPLDEASTSDTEPCLRSHLTWCARNKNPTPLEPI